MTHLKGKTSAQKRFIKRHLNKASKKEVYRIYLATEKAIKYNEKRRTYKKY